MGRSEEPELTAMTKERTKRLTMGAPVPRVTQGELAWCDWLALTLERSAAVLHGMRCAFQLH